MMIARKRMALTDKERQFLGSLNVLYKDMLRDPDLWLNRKTGKITLFEYHECTLKDFISHVHNLGYEEADFEVQIYLDKEDAMGDSAHFVRHYKLQKMGIDVSETLDEFGIIPMLLTYFKDVGFETGECRVIEQILYEREKAKLG